LFTFLKKETYYGGHNTLSGILLNKYAAYQICLKKDRNIKVKILLFSAINLDDSARADRSCD
jgi:hypothetical protein